jgi:hypothetical protein
VHLKWYWLIFQCLLGLIYRDSCFSLKINNVSCRWILQGNLFKNFKSTLTLVPSF